MSAKTDQATTARSYLLASVGDFAAWRRVSRQAAHLQTGRLWFPAPLGRISGGKLPIWDARTAARAYLAHALTVAYLPTELIALMEQEETAQPGPIPSLLCGVAEVAAMIRVSSSGAARITFHSWFPKPLDYVNDKYAVWDELRVREALVLKGGYRLYT